MLDQGPGPDLGRLHRKLQGHAPATCCFAGGKRNETSIPKHASEYQNLKMHISSTIMATSGAACRIEVSTPLLNQGISWTLRGRPRGFCYQPVGHNTSSPSNQNGITFSASWFSLGRSVKGLSTEKRPRKTESAFLFLGGNGSIQEKISTDIHGKDLQHHELNWEPKLIVTHSRRRLDTQWQEAFAQGQ